MLMNMLINELKCYQTLLYMESQRSRGTMMVGNSIRVGLWLGFMLTRVTWMIHTFSKSARKNKARHKNTFLQFTKNHIRRYY